jgi:signal transduction histidine kinase
MRDHASLGARLLTAAGALIAVALIVATVLIGFVLHRFVQGQIDQRLDTQIVFLTSLLRTDAAGRLSLAGSADGPPFERPHRGWYWQVVGPANALTSLSLDGADLDGPAQAARDGMHPPPRKARDDRPQPADGIGPDGDHLHYRIKTVRIGTNDVRIVTSAPRAAVLGPLREAMTTLALSLLVLGLALVLAILLQIRLGLRPLETLRHALADVRAGRSERVPPRQPREIRPLVDELNGLLEQNAAGLERARRHVANLAHGLKTPLATLAIATASGDQRNVATLHPLVIQMERRIRHHLGRARAAALDGPVRTQTPIAPRLQDLVDVLAKIHGERHVAVTMDVPDTLVVACEAQDFDEMAGNLLDNAFKFTRSTVHLRAVQTEAMIALTVNDNGPGLTPQQRTHVLRPGQRLDEAAPGFGFGLSITRELAELYGGDLILSEAPDGGLSAVLQLAAPPLASAR